MRETLARLETRECLVMENCGQQIFGILHRPLSHKNPPIVVVLHGFASSKHGSNRCYVSLAENLAKVGIATFRFDFRGSGDSEGTLSDITLEDLISDAESVVKNLVNVSGINVQQMALFGASLGGSIAILTAMRTKLIKAMALWAPVASGELWYRDFLRGHPEFTHADPREVLSTYRGITLHPQFKEQFASMMTHHAFQQLQPLPVLHMHGEKDEIVSIAHQEAYQKICTPQQTHVRFLKYPESAHSLGYSPSYANVLQDSVRWFQATLC